MFCLSLSGAALMLAATAGAATPERSTEAFYREAVALRGKGAMALFSSRLKPVMQEGQAAGVSARDQRRATVARGERPSYCPPAKGALDSDELLGLLGRIPAEERGRLPLSQGMARAFAMKWPCK
jgi:hypothetical protein